MTAALDALLALPAQRFLREVSAWDDPDDADAALWARCRTDRGLFCLTFFPERFSVRFSKLHRAFLRRPKVPWDQRTRPERYVDAAPRGAAKSTLQSYANVVHDIVYGFELFVALLSTSFDLAEDLVKDLHQTFSEPDLYPDLHQLYGPFRVTGTKTDFVVYVPGGDARGVRVKAFSFGGSIRGSKHAGVRITKGVLDDAEHPDRVRTPGRRAKTWEFLTKDVLKAGGRYSRWEVLGTVLHPESMLARLLISPVWQAERWRAVISFPKRMDMWEAAHKRWSKLEDPDRRENALAFYQAHRAEMDEGAVVLWPEMQSLFDLFEILWSDGPAAFGSEYQNEPADPERQVFHPERFARCRFVDGERIVSAEGTIVPLSACRISIWLDPRKGSDLKRNDFAAVATVAEGPSGYRYVLGCDLARESPAATRGRMWRHFDRWGERAIYGYEANGVWQLHDEGFRRERERRKAAGRPWRFDPKAHGTFRIPKEDRILSVEPDVTNGWLQFADSLSQHLMGMFRDFPTADHDDGPDAVERAVWQLGERRYKARFGHGPL